MVGSSQQGGQSVGRHRGLAGYQAHRMLAVKARPPDQRHQLIVGLRHPRQQRRPVHTNALGEAVDRFQSG